MNSFESSAAIPEYDPRGRILSLMQEASSMGANDSELIDLQHLINRIDATDPAVRLSGDEAVAQAYAIIARKQAYH